MLENEKFVDKCRHVVGYQSAEVSAPITVEPFVQVVSTKTHCYGKPHVKPDLGPCEDKCRFKIKQRVCMEVCVEFGAKALMEKPIIECLKVSDKDICKDYPGCEGPCDDVWPIK